MGLDTYSEGNPPHYNKESEDYTRNVSRMLHSDINQEDEDMSYKSLFVAGVVETLDNNFVMGMNKLTDIDELQAFEASQFFLTKLDTDETLFLLDNVSSSPNQTPLKNAITTPDFSLDNAPSNPNQTPLKYTITTPDFFLEQCPIVSKFPIQQCPDEIQRKTKDKTERDKCKQIERMKKDRRNKSLKEKRKYESETDRAKRRERNNAWHKRKREEESQTD